MEQADTALAEAEANATEALAQWKRAEIEAARIDLWRKRKLYEGGVGSKSGVKRAEENLAALEGTGR